MSASTSAAIPSRFGTISFSACRTTMTRRLAMSGSVRAASTTAAMVVSAP
jgi:hypothetical protein